MVAPGCRRWSVVLVAAVAAVLPSCLPSSKHPLSDPTASKPDDRLVGEWRREVQGETIYWFIGRYPGTSPAPGLMVVTELRLGTDGKLSLADYPNYFFATPVGDRTFANALNWPDGDAPRSGPPRPGEHGYTFFKYTVEGNRLTVWLMDESAVAAAIDRGELKGTVHRGAGNSRVEMTASSAELVQFVVKNDATLFTGIQPLVFERKR